MRKYFWNQLAVSLLLIGLCRISHSSDRLEFQCSPEIIDSLCESQGQLEVCAVDNEGDRLTFSSACEACKNQQILGYNKGSCTCPDIPCNQQQVCVEGSCLEISQIDVNQLSQLAYQLLSEQKNKQALKVMQKVLQITQQDSNLYYLASLAAFSNDDARQSLKYIKKAIQIDPEVPEYYIIRGRAFSEINQFDIAARQFQNALSFNFDDIGLVHFYQAQNLLKNKKNQQAIKKFESALKYHPQKTEWYVRKALAHLINKQDKMALLTCKEGLKIDPNNQQIKLFMTQFKNIDEGKQKDLEKLQQRNEFPQDQSKQKIDPEYISKLIQQRKQEQIMNFQKQRLDQKRIKQQKEKEL